MLGSVGGAGSQWSELICCTFSPWYGAVQGTMLSQYLPEQRVVVAAAVQGDLIPEGTDALFRINGTGSL